MISDLNWYAEKFLEIQGLSLQASRQHQVWVYVCIEGVGKRVQIASCRFFCSPRIGRFQLKEHRWLHFKQILGNWKYMLYMFLQRAMV